VGLNTSVVCSGCTAPETDGLTAEFVEAVAAIILAGADQSAQIAANCDTAADNQSAVSAVCTAPAVGIQVSLIAAAVCAKCLPGADKTAMH